MKGKLFLTAAITVAAVVCMGTVYAAVGTQEDPLVTLSYLNDKFAPDVLSQVDARVAEQQGELKAQLDQQIQDFTKDIQSQLGQTAEGGTQAGGGSVYSVVSLSAGQTLIGETGCEVMLRAGSAVCVSSVDPGLIDMTDGTTLNGGKGLVKNHLYMMTADERGVKADDDVTLLVRGGYTIQ